jgi:S1-C subfamily serine protease
VNTVQDLLTEIDRYKPGERVIASILRNNKKMDVPVTLEDTPRK